MEKRSFERIDTDVDVRFSYGYIFYTGSIKNLSERGLYIRTKNCLPDNSLILIMFRVEDELLKILARVKRSTKSNRYNDSMGIAVLNPQRKYIDYVNNMKSIYSS
ncbi:MAG: PilZ domain-containing protein [Nitrospirota bacterium]